MSTMQLACLVVVYALALVPSCALPSATSEQLVGVFVVHRHGARWPMPSVNASGVCGEACGVLNPTGAAMLSALGAAIRARYAGFNGSTSSESGVLSSRFPTRYDPRVSSSSSSDAQRTVQSAFYMVRGLFASPMAKSGPDVAPVIATNRLDDNRRLLVWTGWPSLVAWSNATATEFNQWCTNTSRQLATLMELDHIVDAAITHGISAECPPRTSWPSDDEPPPSIFQCALDLQDMWESMSAVASDADFIAHCPQLHFLAPLLNRFVIAYNNYSWYRSSDPWWRAVGAKGYYLVQDIMQRAVAAAESAATVSPLLPPTVAIHEYSGHDITLMPLAESMGNDTLLRPHYAAAMIFEAWMDAEDPSAVTLRAFYGEPQRPPGADGSGPYSYDFEPTPMRCVDTSSSGGGTYVAGADGCPLGHWRAFLETRFGAATDDPACFMVNDFLGRFGCASDADAGAPVAGSTCATYRQACPLTACHAGSLSTASSRPLRGGSQPFNATASGPPVRGPGPNLTCLPFDYGAMAESAEQWRLATFITLGVAVIALLLCGALICCRRRCSSAAADGLGGSAPECRPWWARPHHRINSDSTDDSDDGPAGSPTGGGGKCDRLQVEYVAPAPPCNERAPLVVTAAPLHPSLRNLSRSTAGHTPPPLPS